MSLKLIQKLEERPLFKIFLKRIWLKDYSEYLQLFGNNQEKREEAIKRFLNTYNY